MQNFASDIGKRCDSIHINMVITRAPLLLTGTLGGIGIDQNNESMSSKPRTNIKKINNNNNNRNKSKNSCCDNNTARVGV